MKFWFSCHILQKSIAFFTLNWYTIFILYREVRPMESIYVIISTAVAFIAIILLLATKSRVASKVTSGLIALAAISGLLIYGYGFSQTLDDFPLAVVRALLAVCGMFLGKNELSAISGAPLMQEPWAQTIFWLVHLLALYIIASAAIVAVGAEALKKLRLWLARRGRLNVIYGINDDSLSLGKQLSMSKGESVVFIDRNASANAVSAISNYGAVLRTDFDALSSTLKFLHSIALSRRGRELTVYALSKDPAANIGYAEKLLKSLQERNVSPHKTRLVILCQEDRAIAKLQVGPNTYGFGFVAAVNEAELAARVLVRNFPPYRHMQFDADAKATSDFRVLIVGFGQTAQAVLRQLTMNCQFEGSTFHAAVFAPDCQRVDGYFASSYSALLENYDIQFFPCDARSRAMTEYLQAHGNRLSYVAICTGSEKTNREIAEDLCAHFSRHHLDVPVYECSRKCVKAYGSDGTVYKQEPLYQPHLLNMRQLDLMAMALNHQYMQPTQHTALECWMDCDYFSRQSSRASADFADAMVFAATGQDPHQWDPSDWAPTQAQLLNLSKTEHLRWCAFHYCMGFLPMSDEEFDRRAAEYTRQKQENGKATIRIAKNMAGRTHACLTPWEELLKLSEKEQAITGRYTDYQHMDTQNVLMIPKLYDTTWGVGL